MTATGSTAFVVEIQALQKLLAEKEAEIERLREQVSQKDAVLASVAREGIYYRALLARAADALEDLDRFAFYCWSARNEKLPELIKELRKAAE